jgi:hypothetical protein
VLVGGALLAFLTKLLLVAQPRLKSQATSRLRTLEYPGNFVPAEELVKAGNRRDPRRGKRRYTAEEIVTVLRQVKVVIANGKATPQTAQGTRGGELAT